MDFVDRFPLYTLIFSFVFYPVLAWPILRFAPRSIRTPLFALFNIFGLAVMCFLTGAHNVRLKSAGIYTKTAMLFFVLYVALTLVHYVSLRRMKVQPKFWTGFAFSFPLVLLGYIKYLSGIAAPFHGLMHTAGISSFALLFIGISYLSFRLVHLVQEVRNDFVEMPTVWEYLAFAFFIPTLSIGPITPYSRFIRSYRTPDRERTPLMRSWVRIIVGFTKYIFLGSIAAQFTYGGLLLNGHPHSWLDFAIAVPAYAIYLYLNFSGFCDMVIGVAGLLNIEVMENFDRPFLARNFQEFWSRWHISLSTWIRDIVFTPMSKALIRRMGPKKANDAIAITVFTSFVLVGIWHGKGWNFVLFGILQGIGLVTVHYYTVWLKKRLGRDRFAAYRQNLPIRIVSTTATFLYFAFTSFFFANTLDQMAKIWRSLHGS